MSNARNRKRTTGAFGNTKPRSISPTREFRHIPANIPVVPPQAGEDRVSDILLEFSKPILEQAGNNHTAARGAMNVAVLIWNGLVEGGKALEASREKLLALPGATAEQVEELVATMRERKATLFPEAKHLVMDFSVSFDKRGGLQLRVASMNLAPKGVEKVI
jgi:hypothetical protein